MSEKIVFLDASTIDYGDIDFSSLKAIGEFVCYDNTPVGKISERLKGATVAITNKVPFTREILASVSGLKHIAVAATGYNIIDIDAARDAGISVSNVPGYSTSSVAQLTMSFILALTTNLVKYDRDVHKGEWSRSPIFTLGSWPVLDLDEMTIGIMGSGAIGSRVAELCAAFGMNVLKLAREGIKYNADDDRRTLEQLASESDIISIHMPLSDYSRGLINTEFLDRMKKGSFLINMARGEIVEPVALKRALESGHLAGAALDVMAAEPPSEDDPILKAPNLLITPHVAWASRSSRSRLAREIALNISSALKGEKRNLVSE